MTICTIVNIYKIKWLKYMDVKRVTFYFYFYEVFSLVFNFCKFSNYCFRINTFGSTLELVVTHHIEKQLFSILERYKCKQFFFCNNQNQKHVYFS